ncbi:hypothetical protein BS47DRAFT_145604 [Hydnum rufescens UP504]|uniref:Uncharacterized protein n=1 Tax=Hydnum rufescens UP504 TaxID=1448309 RepID=A0A9P6APY7_9AGAM|nr:hypothetical protein BS47DRAFT_736132 [Hydnum rufescens UP504]KAF9509537.1 hypothetical protein BS47DRAFT_145604 [Hydnum rufescens UP504]
MDEKSIMHSSFPLLARPISGFTFDSSSSGLATVIVLLSSANSPMLHPDLPPTPNLMCLETVSSSVCTTMHTHSDFLSSLQIPHSPRPLGCKSKFALWAGRCPAFTSQDVSWRSEAWRSNRPPSSHFPLLLCLVCDRS